MVKAGTKIPTNVSWWGQGKLGRRVVVISTKQKK